MVNIDGVDVVERILLLLLYIFHKYNVSEQLYSRTTNNRSKHITTLLLPFPMFLSPLPSPNLVLWVGQKKTVCDKDFLEYINI